MDELFGPLQTLGRASPISITHFAITVLFATLLSYCCVKVHLLSAKQKIKKNEYQQLLRTTVLLAPTVSLIILVIGSNLALAFALMGMLSLVRFRNPSKGPGDLVFVFLSITIGMTCGAQYFMLALAFTAMVVVIILVINLLHWGMLEKEIKTDENVPK